MNQPAKAIECRRAIIELACELIPREEHNTWFLTPHLSLNSYWPSLAMQKGNEDAVYSLLLRLRR